MCSISVCETKLEQYLESRIVKQVFVWDSKGKSLPKYTVPLEEILDSTFVSPGLKKEEGNACNGNRFNVTYDSEEKLEANVRHTKDLPAFILSSSGSTGLPKGVVLTHFNITTALTTRYVHPVWRMRCQMSRSTTVLGHLPSSLIFCFT
jgi:long-subunit acyl-CoA synthetase (AMP-forming)